MKSKGLEHFENQALSHSANCTIVGGGDSTAIATGVTPKSIPISSSTTSIKNGDYANAEYFGLELIKEEPSGLELTLEP